MNGQPAAGDCGERQPRRIQRFFRQTPEFLPVGKLFLVAGLPRIPHGLPGGYFHVKQFRHRLHHRRRVISGLLRVARTEHVEQSACAFQQVIQPGHSVNDFVLERHDSHCRRRNTTGHQPHWRQQCAHDQQQRPGSRRSGHEGQPHLDNRRVKLPDPLQQRHKPGNQVVDRRQQNATDRNAHIFQVVAQQIELRLSRHEALFGFIHQRVVFAPGVIGNPNGARQHVCVAGHAAQRVRHANTVQPQLVEHQNLLFVVELTQSDDEIFEGGNWLAAPSLGEFFR